MQFLCVVSNYAKFPHTAPIYSGLVSANCSSELSSDVHDPLESSQSSTFQCDHQKCNKALDYLLFSSMIAVIATLPMDGMIGHRGGCKLGVLF
jgi:hypothetical protein